MEYDLSPFHRRLEAGQDPDAAWAEAQPEIEEKARRLGGWASRPGREAVVTTTCTPPDGLHSWVRPALPVLTAALPRSPACMQARRGTWLRDTFYTGPDASGRWCHLAEIK